MVAENLEKPADVEINGGQIQAKEHLPGSATTDDGLSSSSSSFLYFSYGSNLLTERIHVHITDAAFLTTAVLADFELTFFDRSERWQGAVASVHRKPGARVWGCVWRVPNTFGPALDKQELGYHRMDVSVSVGTDTAAGADSAGPLSAPFASMLLLCRTYQYSNPDRKLNCPSPHYRQVIIAGAIEHGLPPAYVEWLRNNFPTNGFCGSVTLKLKAIAHLNTEKSGGEAVEEEEEPGQQNELNP